MRACRGIRARKAPASQAPLAREECIQLQIETIMRDPAKKKRTPSSFVYYPKRRCYRNGKVPAGDRHTGAPSVIFTSLFPARERLCVKNLPSEHGFRLAQKRARNV